MSTKPATRRTIFLVEDHPIVCRGLTALINDEPDLTICGQADNATDALARIEALRPDSAVVDIGLKNGSGLELIKQLRACNNPVLILVASEHDEDLYAERVIRAGARGYITKQQATDNIVVALRQVLAGRIYLSQHMADRVLQRLGNHEPPAGRTPVEALSDRELEVFSLIGQGLSTGSIAAQLHLSTKTVGTHRENIKTKLQLKSSGDLMRHAVEWLRDQQN